MSIMDYRKINYEIIDNKSSSQIKIYEDNYCSVKKPWGEYKVIDEGTGFKVKRITVNPKHRLSLQIHQYRSEHWTVVAGTAKATIGKKEKTVNENESIYIPTTTLHRLENIGETVLVVIEVQFGDYLEEDDIVRYSDDYNRIID